MRNFANGNCTDDSVKLWSCYLDHVIYDCDWGNCWQWHFGISSKIKQVTFCQAWNSLLPWVRVGSSIVFVSFWQELQTFLKQSTNTSQWHCTVVLQQQCDGATYIKLIFNNNDNRHINHWWTQKIHLSVSAFVNSSPKGKCGRLPQHCWLRLDAVAVVSCSVKCGFVLVGDKKIK